MLTDKGKFIYYDNRGREEDIEMGLGKFLDTRKGGVLKKLLG